MIFRVDGREMEFSGNDLVIIKLEGAKGSLKFYANFKAPHDIRMRSIINRHWRSISVEDGFYQTVTKGLRAYIRRYKQAAKTNPHLRRA